jgi:hypothetical protein
MSTHGRSPRVLQCSLETKVVNVEKINSLLVNSTALQLTALCKLSKDRNSVGARCSKSLEPPGRQSLVVGKTLVVSPC